MLSWCGTRDTSALPVVRKSLHTRWLCLLQRLRSEGRNDAVNGLSERNARLPDSPESAGRVASVAHDGDGGRA